jgi:hypothetical protein
VFAEVQTTQQADNIFGRKPSMRTVTLEEHFTVPAVVQRIDKAAIARRGFKPRKPPAGRANPFDLLPEMGEKRLGTMDEAGITVQVLSNSGPGPELMAGADGVALAREVNDTIAAFVARNPTRFASFAALPLQDPEASAAELKRAVKDLKLVGAMVHGTTDDKFLDDPRFDILLAAAVELDVPIYIHPNLPAAPVMEAYYSNLPDGADRVLSTAVWGWH